MRSHAANTIAEDQCDPVDADLQATDAQQLDRLRWGLRTGWSYSLAFDCTQGMAERPLSLALQIVEDYLTAGDARTRSGTKTAQAD